MEEQGYILIAEDDNDISHMLTELLTLHGYRAVQAFSGTEAMLYVRQEAPQAVILDLMLPGLAGEEVLAAIRKEAPQTAVLVASAKDDVKVRIDLLRAGADDYLTKPFDTGELLARLEAVLRRRGTADRVSVGVADGQETEPAPDGGAGQDRSRAQTGYPGRVSAQTGHPGQDRAQTGHPGSDGTFGGTGIPAERKQGTGRQEMREAGALCFRDITLYPQNFTAFVGDKELSLTRCEYRILELLMGNPEKVFTKSNIYESVWNEEFLGEENAVNVHISNLRQKLAKLSPGEAYIQTVWGIGFKMKQT